VTDRSPSLAARIANTYVQQYITFRQTSDQAQLTQAEQTVKSQLAAIPSSQRTSALAQSLQSRSYQLGLLASLQTGNAEVVQTAVAPSAPSSPNPPANAVIGLLLGLVFAGLLVFGFDRYDTRIKSLEDIEELFDAPVIGTVPESQLLRRAGSPGTAREQDAFRMVRAQLRYFDVDRDVRSVMITSANISEGKSTLALNLARASAAGIGHRTLLIDADLRRPSIARMLGVDGLVGLSELLTHSQDLTSGLRELVVSPTFEDEAAGANFDVLVAGSIPPNPAELLESQRMTELLAAAESAYDLVIVDTPPIGVVSDPIGLVRQVDGVLLVARLGRSRRDHALRLIKQLRGLNAHVLGVVVNGVAAATGYSYGYAAYSEPVAEEGTRGRSRVRSGRSR
jgi:polysaccharide biosynthesis transport protein